MIPKPGKDQTIPSSYRPIGLLSCLSKLLEKAFSRAWEWFYLRSHNRITSEIRTAFEHREYCSAVFLGVSQAFDRDSLEGLMQKSWHS